MRRRASNVPSDKEDEQLPLHSATNGGTHKNKRRRSKRRKRDSCGSFLLGVAVVVGIVLMVLFLTKKPPTDAATIPDVQKFLKQAQPVANQQYAVFVTKSNGHGDTQTALGRSPTSPMDALQQAQRHLPTFTARFPWIEVGVVTATKKIQDDWNSRDKLLHAPDWWYGIALDWDTGWAFSPEEVNAHVLVDNHDRLRWDRLGQYSYKRGLKGWPTPDDMVDDSTYYSGYEYVTTETLFCDLSQQEPLEPVTLYHGHYMYPQLSPELLKEHAIQAGKHLTSSIRDDGSMLYIYYPRSDTTPDDENLTRHSGTLYAMSCLLQIWPNVELRQAIERGLDYILNLVKPCPVPYSPKDLGMCVHDDGRKSSKISKLGENALTLLGLVQYMDATGGDTRHLQVARDMASWIVGSQKSDGSFVQKIQVKPKLTLDEDYFVRYYQGEATFALAKLYRVLKKYGHEYDEQWMSVANKSALFIVDKDSKATDQDLTNDHWLMYGIGEMHPELPNEILQKHALRTARVAREMQTLEENDIGLDRLGAFEDYLSVTSMATFTEGICAVHDMAVDIGKAKEASTIVDTITLAMRHELQGQWKKGDMMLHMRDPDKIEGAFHNTIMKYDMRNDYTQHNLSAMLCIARILAAAQNET